MFDLGRPIYTLTVGELLGLLRQAQDEKTPTNRDLLEQQQNDAPRRLVYGVHGLANLLGVSNATAQRIKSSGKINAAISQQGRRFVADADKVLEILNLNTQKQQQ